MRSSLDPNAADSRLDLPEAAVAVTDIRRRRERAIEWPTFAALAACYALWAATLWFHDLLPLPLFAALSAYAVALQSSLRHEALHGHPTRHLAINEALVFPPLCLMIPYRRFRATHLRHHFDSRLTDPYDDPESWYLADREYRELSRPLRLVLSVNNTLAGRLVLGPPLSVFGLVRHDLRRILAGDRSVARAWGLHVAGAVPVLAYAWGVCGVGPVAYVLLVSWPGLSLLMLRTFAEHRAHPEVGRRTAIIEASPLFGFLFLNNNLHYVHHQRPRVPWYDLPRVYRAERDRYREENGGYGFDGYLDLARRHLFRRKEPVAHPFLRR